MNEKLSAEAIIRHFELEPLPSEGGYFRRTYEAAERLAAPRAGVAVNRAAGTAIYYLVTPESFSALHRVRSDELFHFYAGDPVEMLLLGPNGEESYRILSNRLAQPGEWPQYLVPAGTWQGLRLLAGGRWALLGTTVCPGFDYDDFELANRAELTGRFPHAAGAIARFTREA